MSNKMVVEIFGGTCSSSCATCSGSCSVEGAGPEIEQEAVQLADQLKDQYGENIGVKYIDTDQVGLSSYPMLSRAMQAGYTFPIVSLNGKPRLAGGIDFASVREIIEEELAKNGKV